MPGCVGLGTGPDESGVGVIVAVGDCVAVPPGALVALAVAVKVAGVVVSFEADVGVSVEIMMEEVPVGAAVPETAVGVSSSSPGVMVAPPEPIGVTPGSSSSVVLPRGTICTTPPLATIGSGLG